MGSGFEPLAPHLEPHLQPHLRKQHLLILFRGTSAWFHDNGATPARLLGLRLQKATVTVASARSRRVMRRAVAASSKLR